MKEENIVKKVCGDLGITQKDLAEKIGVADGTVRKWASGAAPIPTWANKFFDLLIEYNKQNKIVKQTTELFTTLLEYSSKEQK